MASTQQNIPRFNVISKYAKIRLCDVITATLVFFNAALSLRQLFHNFHQIDTFCYITICLVGDWKISISAHIFIQNGVRKITENRKNQNMRKLQNKTSILINVESLIKNKSISSSSTAYSAVKVKKITDITIKWLNILLTPWCSCFFLILIWELIPFISAFSNCSRIENHEKN